MKQSINGAQDAMGYRSALQGAHSNYMIMELAISDEQAGKMRQNRRMGGVAAALAKESAS